MEQFLSSHIENIKKRCNDLRNEYYNVYECIYTVVVPEEYSVDLVKSKISYVLDCMYDIGYTVQNENRIIRFVLFEES